MEGQRTGLPLLRVEPKSYVRLVAGVGLGSAPNYFTTLRARTGRE